MRRIFLAALLSAIAATAACGSKHSAPAKPTAGSGSGSGAGSADLTANHTGESDEMSPELKKYHDVLAPLWHAQKGPERTKNTCAAAPELKTDADAIATATPPTSANADSWTAGTRALVDAATKLGDACKTNDDAKFEAAFSKLHDAFHALMGMAGMHHDESHKGSGDMGGAGSASMQGMHHPM